MKKTLNKVGIIATAAVTGLAPLSAPVVAFAAEDTQKPETLEEAEKELNAAKEEEAKAQKIYEDTKAIVEKEEAGRPEFFEKVWTPAGTAFMKAQEDVQAAEQNLTDAQNNLEAAQKTLEDLKNGESDLEEAEDAIAEAEKAVTEAEKVVEEAEAELEAAQKIMDEKEAVWSEIVDKYGYYQLDDGIKMHYGLSEKEEAYKEAKARLALAQANYDELKPADDKEDGKDENKDESKENAKDESKDNAKDKTTDTVKTGDPAPLAGLIGTMLASGSTVIALGRKKRK